METMS